MVIEFEKPLPCSVKSKASTLFCFLNQQVPIWPRKSEVMIERSVTSLWACAAINKRKKKKKIHPNITKIKEIL